MFGFEWLEPSVIYVALSAVVAILIWIEGEILKKTQGKLPKSVFFHASSLIDTSWFVISMVVIYFIDISSVALAVPAAYGLYTIGGWFYGSRLLSHQKTPDSVDKLVIPKPYIAYSQSFALIFFSLCLLVLASPWIMPIRTL